MRILHILNDVTELGNGIVNTAVDLAIAQARQGDDVAVAASTGGYQALLIRSGVKMFPLDQSLRPRALYRALWMLHGDLREYQPEVVHAHMRTGLLLAWLLRPFHRYTLVGHLHNVHDRQSLLMGLADKVIAVSEAVAQSMVSCGIPRRKIRVVLNRTLGSKRVLPASRAQPARLQRPCVVTVCGMSQRKGIEELIHAFELVGQHFGDAHLYLVGDGPDRASFQSRASTSRFSDFIHFEGFQANPQAYMRSADVFILASRRESFGLVLIEAREAGCAIVATDVDGIAEALDGGRAGLLVPPKDPRALASAICRILSDESVRRELQSKSKENLSLFRVEVMAREMTAVYNELLDARCDLHASGRMRRKPLVGESE